MATSVSRTPPTNLQTAETCADLTAAERSGRYQAKDGERKNLPPVVSTEPPLDSGVMVQLVEDLAAAQS